MWWRILNSFYALLSSEFVGKQYCVSTVLGKATGIAHGTSSDLLFGRRMWRWSPSRQWDKSGSTMWYFEKATVWQLFPSLWIEPIINRKWISPFTSVQKKHVINIINLCNAFIKFIVMVFHMEIYLQHIGPCVSN